MTGPRLVPPCTAPGARGLLKVVGHVENEIHGGRRLLGEDGNVTRWPQQDHRIVCARLANARPGIIMEANNAVGDFYRQEFSLDNAEDLAEVQALSESVTVPYGSFTGCLKTLETTPLNLSDVSNKFYCPGIGEVLTQDLPGGERLELVQVRTE